MVEWVTSIVTVEWVGSRRGSIGDSQLCRLRYDGIAEEDTIMCLLDESDHRSP